MARKRQEVDDLEGTVEGLARDHFEREKAAYEERTGEKVQFVPPTPVTRTPIPEPVVETEPAENEAAADQPSETTQSEGEN